MNLTSQALSILTLFALAPLSGADSLNGTRSAVARVGDVNGDGVPDLAVASRDRARPERVWILSGKDGARLLEIAGRSAGDRFGSEIGALGDWDRDGTPDLFVVARPRFPSRPDPGYCRLISGRSGATLAEFEGSGAIGGAHDLDGDGRLDLLLVVEGARAGTSAVVVLSGYDGSELLRIPGTGMEGANEGPVVEALTWLDDVDHDGRRDFAVARSRSVQLERNGDVQISYDIRVVSGRTGRALWTTPSEPGQISGACTIARIADASADGVDDLLCALEDRYVRLIDGKDGSTRWQRDLPRHVLYSFGSSLDRVGDLDRDGIEDLVIAANESWGDFFDAGLCDVMSGKSGELLQELPEDEKFGFDACGLGDVNGDGVPDFAIGAECQRGWMPDDSSEPAVQVRSGKDWSIVWMRRHVDLRR